MKILCLIDNPVKPGDRWLWNYLPSSNDEVDFQVATGAVDRFKKWGKLITYYPAFMRSGLRAFVKTRKTPYDVVIAWGGPKWIYLRLTAKYVRAENPAADHIILQPSGRPQPLSRPGAIWDAFGLTSGRFYPIRS